MKLSNSLLLAILILVSCKKDKTSSTSNSDPADKFVKSYSVTEDMVQTFGGSQTNHEVFNASIIKVNSNTVKFNDQRTPLPVYSINGSFLNINNDSISLGTLKGKRFGTDSLVITYLYGAGSDLYSVKWVCK